MKTQVAILLLTCLLVSGPVYAIPQFARQYAVDCAFCHVTPPRLNQRGEDFLARGYRFAPERPVPSHRTLPVAVWNTFDLEHRQSGDLTKAYPSRIELISSGAIGASRASYFLEWRALSQQIGARNRLLDRSGRFEDALINVPLTRSNALVATVGQFRALNQVDVSRRLSISEPLAFSASVPGRTPATTARLTGLRAFSPSGRQPAARVAYQRGGGENAAEGWHSLVTIPLTGELTIPLTDAASLEFEARPKGVFLESYYRFGLHSIGGHAFVGDRRSLGHVVAVSDIAQKLLILGAVGFGHSRGLTDTRLSLGGEYVFNQHAVTGVRVDHRTRQGRDPAVLLFFNGHVPFGPVRFRQSFRVQFEQTVQPNNHRSTLALSHIF